MKKALLFLAAAMIKCTMLSAQAHQSTDEGYVFVTNLKSYSQKSLKSRVKSTISAGKVAIKNDNNELRFPSIDVAEYIVLGSGSFHQYFPPAQDLIPAEYISSAGFKKAVRKVSINKQVPTSWDLDKVYTLKPAYPDKDIKPVTVKALRLSNDNITLATAVDENFKTTSSINISGETIIEIVHEFGTTYFYNGQQIVLESSTTGEDDFYILQVDDKGVTYAKNEEGARKRDTKLSYVFGAYPEIDYFGWISDKEIVMNDILYVVASH